MTAEIKNSIKTIIPSVNIVETKNSYVVTLDIPGAIKEKINAKIENNELVVTADVADYFADDSTENTKQYRREFSIADNIDVNSVNASHDLGVLTVTLNKKQQFLPKEISIN